MKAYLVPRLNQILTGKDQSGLYGTLSNEDRIAVRQILRETQPDFRAWLAE